MPTVSRIRDQLLAVVNGVVGDYLVRSENTLAIDSDYFVAGKPLPHTTQAFATQFPDPSAKVVVFVHGLMGTERNWRIAPPKSVDAIAVADEDFGIWLTRDVGYTALYVRYNSGQPIADSGAQFASLLDVLVRCYPREISHLLLIGHSMGGLVIRAACHQGSIDHARWLAIPTRAIYVGTPHRGAPFERLGRLGTNLLAAINDPVTRLIASIAQNRSAGIQDLGDADLRHQDRARRLPHYSLRDPRHPVPLLPNIKHLLIAGAISDKAWLSALFGDSIVPLASARYDGGIDPNNVVTITGISHTGMLTDSRVYQEMLRWISPATESDNAT
jgi:triacylglycerol lipase